MDCGVYTHHMFLPCLLPFEATYNDYGAGENSKGVGLPWVLEGIRKNLIELEQGENSYHDLAVKRDKFDVDLLYEACHEGRLLTKGFSGEQHRLHFVMMRKDVVDKILSKSIYERYDVGSRKHIEYTFSDILNSVDEVLDHSINILTGLPYAILINPRTLLLPVETLNHASYWLQSSSEYRTNQSCIFNMWEVYTDLLEKRKLKEAKELIVEYLKGLCIDDFMDSTRRSWAPPSGEGSQGDSYIEHRLLANITLDTLAKLENNE